MCINVSFMLSQSPDQSWRGHRSSWGWEAVGGRAPAGSEVSRVPCQAKEITHQRLLHTNQSLPSAPGSPTHSCQRCEGCFGPSLQMRVIITAARLVKPTDNECSAERHWQDDGGHVCLRDLSSWPICWYFCARRCLTNDELTFRWNREDT